MARIVGVDLPKNKRGEIGLTYIFGIGRSIANKILQEAGVDKEIKVKDWTDDQISNIRKVINENYKVEGELRSGVQMNIKRLMDIGSYRGIRHRTGLPVRGQSTKNNARTRKGRRRTVANKSKTKNLRLFIHILLLGKRCINFNYSGRIGNFDGQFPVTAI